MTTEVIPLGGQHSQGQGVGGNVHVVFPLLTRRRAVDYCRVDSSLCLASD